MKNLSIEYFRSLSRMFLLPEEVAPILECTPQSIRVAARQRPELLGFPTIIIGNRVKIPRIPFLNLMTGGSNE